MPGKVYGGRTHVKRRADTYGEKKEEEEEEKNTSSFRTHFPGVSGGVGARRMP